MVRYGTQRGQSLLTESQFLGLIRGCLANARAETKGVAFLIRPGPRSRIAHCADPAHGADPPPPWRFGDWATSFISGYAMKRTYQASKTRRARTHGFLVRMKTRGGRAIINARRAKGRKRLAV